MFRVKWVLSTRLLSRLLKLLKKVLLSLINKGQWRRKWVVDSISWPQLHKGLIESWKLCLKLFSVKWVEPGQNLVIILIPWVLWQLELGAGLMNWRIFFLNIDKPLEWQSQCTNAWAYEVLNLSFDIISLWV